MIGIIIQARTGSTRYPRKIYENICGKTTIQRVLEGVNKSQLAHRIILSMPMYDRDEYYDRQDDESGKAITSEHVDLDRFRVYFGDPDDLVKRYLGAAQKHGIDLVVRITGDCPLVQGHIIDEMLLQYLKGGYSGYMGSNYLISSLPYPTGTHAEVFQFWMLAETSMMAKKPNEREHCTPYMYRSGKYNIHEFLNRQPNTTISTRFPDFSFDTLEDLKLIKKITKEYDKHGDLNRAITDAEGLE